MCMCAKSLQSCPTLCNPWTVACQAPLSMGLSRQEYWNGFPCPSPGDLPDPGAKPLSLMSPALAGGFFATSATWVAPYLAGSASGLIGRASLGARYSPRDSEGCRDHGLWLVQSFQCVSICSLECPGHIMHEYKFPKKWFR